MNNAFMFYKMNEKDKELYKKVQDITGTDYEPFGDFISIENLWCMIDELVYAYNCFEEKYKDLVQDVEENYRHIPYEEQL